jgi:hypothetical protein
MHVLKPERLSTSLRSADIKKALMEVLIDRATAASP